VTGKFARKIFAIIFHKAHFEDFAHSRLEKPRYIYFIIMAEWILVKHLNNFIQIHVFLYLAFRHATAILGHAKLHDFDYLTKLIMLASSFSSLDVFPLNGRWCESSVFKLICRGKLPVPHGVLNAVFYKLIMCRGQFSYAGEG